MAVLEEYASNVKTVDHDELAKVAGAVISKMRTEGQIVNTGTVLKALVGPGGELDGKAAEKAEVAKIVKGML